MNALNISQTIQINDLKEEIDNLNLDLSKSTTSSGKAIDALSKELRAFKQDLEKSKTREKEVKTILIP